jgi:hypothetical protein
MNVNSTQFRVALSLALIALATAGAAWSPRLELPVNSGAWGAPGGISDGLALWYDAAEVGSMQFSPRLRYWFDKSGQAQHAAVSPGPLLPYPTLATGVPGLQFTGAAVPIPISIPIEPMTAMIVFRHSSEGLSHPLIGSRTKFVGIAMEYGRLRMYNNGISAGASTARTVTGLTITTIRTVVGGTDSVQYNGGPETTFNFTSAESINWIGGMFVSGSTRLYFVGTMMEVVIWGRSLSPSELESAHRALGAKWGISVP